LASTDDGTCMKCRRRGRDAAGAFNDATSKKLLHAT
jgi:hypothetical protein